MVPTHHTCDYTIPNHTVLFTYYAIPYFPATYCKPYYTILLLSLTIPNEAEVPTHAEFSTSSLFHFSSSSYFSPPFFHFSSNFLLFFSSMEKSAGWIFRQTVPLQKFPGNISSKNMDIPILWIYEVLQYNMS